MCKVSVSDQFYHWQIHEIQLQIVGVLYPWYSVLQWKKVVWTRREIMTDQAMLTKPQLKSKHTLVDFDVRKQKGTSFFTGGSVIMVF